MTHICISKLTMIGSDNGLSPNQRQAIIWTNDGILLVETLGTNFSEILIEIHTFSFKKMHLKMSSEKKWPFCFGLNVFRNTKAGSVIWIIYKMEMTCLNPPVYLHRMLRWQLSTCVCFHSLSTNERSILSCSSSGTLLFVTIGYHEKYPRHVNSLAPGSYDWF